MMENLNKVIDWYQGLSAESLGHIELYYSEEAFFKDPFNELTGVSKIKRIFEDMFEHLDSPRFEFVDIIHQDKEAFLTWNFIFKLKGKEQFHKIHGSSHLKFDEQMKITYHRDYWDVGEELLLKIPLIKNIYGAFRKKLSMN